MVSHETVCLLTWYICAIKRKVHDLVPRLQNSSGESASGIFSVLLLGKGMMESGDVVRNGEKWWILR